MKTQIIQLESHDDTISVKDKMGWGQTPRILLVWPKHPRILARRIDIVLLKRHGISLGSQLAFVTKDPRICGFADQLDIPVYKTIRKAERAHWRAPRRRKRKKKNRIRRSQSRLLAKQKSKEKTDLEELRNLAHPHSKSWLIHPLTRLILFTLGVIGVLAVAAVLVPNAEITISPTTKYQEISFPIKASSLIETIDFSGVVPIHTLSVIIEGSGQIKTTGSISIPNTKAHGNVMFTNLTNKTISIPTGTIVSSSENDPARFSTEELVIVPSLSTSKLIGVVAVEPGSKGNVSPNELDAIEGPLGLDLVVTNPLGIFNGKDKVSPAPDEEDYKNLLEITISRLQEAAFEEINTRQDSEDFFLLAKPEGYRILEENYTPANIQPTDQLNLSLRADFNAYTVSNENIIDLSEYLLQASLPDLYSPISMTPIEVVHVDQPQLIAYGTYQWMIKAKWLIGATIDQEVIIPLLLWEEPTVAVEKIESLLPNDEMISYELRPAWWPRLPILPFRIKLNINY